MVDQSFSKVDTTQHSLPTHKLHKLISGRTLVRSGLKDNVASVLSAAQAQSRSVWYWVPFVLVSSARFARLITLST